jgi:hypothetical protein
MKMPWVLNMTFTVLTSTSPTLIKCDRRRRIRWSDQSFNFFSSPPQSASSYCCGKASARSHFNELLGQ